jgi:hypothetical protein
LACADVAFALHFLDAAEDLNTARGSVGATVEQTRRLRPPETPR